MQSMFLGVWQIHIENQLEIDLFFTLFFTQFKESYFFQVLMKVNFGFTSTFKRKTQMAVFNIMVILWYSPNPGDGFVVMQPLSSGSASFRLELQSTCGYECEKPAKGTKVTMVASFLPSSVPLNGLIHHCGAKGKAMDHKPEGRTG